MTSTDGSFQLSALSFEFSVMMLAIEADVLSSSAARADSRELKAESFGMAKPTFYWKPT